MTSEHPKREYCYRPSKMIVLILLLLLNTAVEGRTLKFVQALWRHGDRAPFGKCYPLDPYDESFWPRGWSQLTNVCPASHHTHFNHCLGWHETTKRRRDLC